MNQIAWQRQEFLWYYYYTIVNLYKYHSQRPKFIGSQVEGDMRSIQEQWRVTLRSTMMPAFLTLFLYTVVSQYTNDINQKCDKCNTQKNLNFFLNNLNYSICNLNCALRYIINHDKETYFKQILRNVNQSIAMNWISYPLIKSFISDIQHR